MKIPPLTQLLREIDVLIEQIQSMRPLSVGELRELQKSLRVCEVYNSNAIEGNTLTLGETKLVIEDGITIGGKAIREMHEATNLAQAIDRVFSQKVTLNEENIRQLHALIMKNIDDENGGIYRKIQVYISGDDTPPPRATEVSGQMYELMDWYSATLETGTLHPVLLASEFHYRFVKIHPFVDGNGRTARLIANMILMAHGYPMVILPVVRRMEYISSLHSQTGGVHKFQNLYADIVHENLKDYMRMID